MNKSIIRHFMVAPNKRIPITQIRSSGRVVPMFKTLHPSTLTENIESAMRSVASYYQGIPVTDMKEDALYNLLDHVGAPTHYFGFIGTDPCGSLWYGFIPEGVEQGECIEQAQTTLAEVMA